MNDGLKLWQLALWITVLCGFFAFGYWSGSAFTSEKLMREAVREKAGMWVAADNGSPEFKWSVCIPARGIPK